jgi:hypothetical protein
MTHTPGPWGIRSRDVGGFVVGPTGDFLPAAIIPKNKREAAEVHANARLIAAAPDMLAALKKMRPSILNRKTLAQIDAAIAKAEGEMPCVGD